MADSKSGLKHGKTLNLPNVDSMQPSISVSSRGIVPVDLHCPTLHEFLLARPKEQLDKFYEYPSICSAVYDELPEYAKHYVMRVLFVEQPVPQAVITSWGMQEYAKEQTDGAALLKQLHIWFETSIPGGLLAWNMNELYRNNLRKALMGEDESSLVRVRPGPEAKGRDIHFLDQYAISRWRSLLHYMVTRSSNIDLGPQSEISPDAVRILLHSNLMKRDDRGAMITRQGFQFLLLDTFSQVRYFMWIYLNTCEEKGFNLPATLSMLFELSQTKFGREYTSDIKDIKMLNFLQHLREFGLVFQKTRKEPYYYPTRLVVNLCKSGPNVEPIVGSRLDKDGGYIVVETNYRVYAYTQSPLQVAIIALFTELQYHFSNLVIGILTRESVRQAINNGLTANQITTYLEQYAHSTMKEGKEVDDSSHVIPPTIIDQIKLWELEGQRLHFTEGIIYNQFLSHTDYITLRDYAQSIGELIWENERIRTMVVSSNGHEDVKRYWKQYSKNAS